jgi:hypothetical protein
MTIVSTIDVYDDIVDRVLLKRERWMWIKPEKNPSAVPVRRREIRRTNSIM